MPPASRRIWWAPLLKAFGMTPGSPEAHALTYLDFRRSREDVRQGRRLRAPRDAGEAVEGIAPGALLLDGGDSWQGSGPALWTRGQDMVDASKLLGVDIMTGHWEFTLGMERVKEIVDKDFAGKIEFLAQNVRTGRLRRSRFSVVHSCVN
jgi:sulfur-oxidizing protein SoxB